MSVKHLRFLKKALYKYKIISIKVGLFVPVGLRVFFFFFFFSLKCIYEIEIYTVGAVLLLFLKS